MLIPVIAQYLRSHRRLIIPQMGAFIVKEPGRSVLFSELLKRDDGVLRSLLVAGGVSELEAGGEIDRFVFEVRLAVQQGREFPLAGLGVLKPGPNETIAFAYAPQTAGPAVEAQAMPAAAHAAGSAGHADPSNPNGPSAPASAIGSTDSATSQAPATPAASAVPATSATFAAPANPAEPAMRPTATEWTAAEQTVIDLTAAEQPTGASAATERTASTPLPADRTAASADPAGSAPSESRAAADPSPARKFSASVGNLYGNSAHAAARETDAARPAAASARTARQNSGKGGSEKKDFGSLFAEQPARPQFSLPRPRRSKRDDSLSDSYYGRLPRRPAIEQTVRVKKRSDHFIWIALIAALIALGAIAFGQWCDKFGREGDEVILEHIDAAEGAYLPPSF